MPFPSDWSVSTSKLMFLAPRKPGALPAAPDFSAAKAPENYKSIQGQHIPGLKELWSVKK